MMQKFTWLARDFDCVCAYSTTDWSHAVATVHPERSKWYVFVYPGGGQTFLKLSVGYATLTEAQRVAEALAPIYMAENTPEE